VQLRHATRADLPTIVDVWTDAFASDPYLTWMGGGLENWMNFGRPWLAFIAELTFERGHTYLADPAHMAVAWIPPDLAFVTPADIERGRAIVAVHTDEAHADAAIAVIVDARAMITEEPHWTLQYIGVRSVASGTGLGTSAVAPMLAVCDAEAMPCALVSSNPRNRPFYQRLGFEVIGESVTPDGEAMMTPMHRNPR
jgi:GNAT superfamily N-acetyltransferase